MDFNQASSALQMLDTKLRVSNVSEQIYINGNPLAQQVPTNNKKPPIPTDQRAAGRMRSVAIAFESRDLIGGGPGAQPFQIAAASGGSEAPSIDIGSENAPDDANFQAGQNNLLLPHVIVEEDCEETKKHQ